MNSMPFLNIIPIIVFFISSSCFSQAYFLKLDKLKNDSVVDSKFYNESHWVKIKTNDRRTLKGPFIVKNQNMVSVNGQEVALDNIYKIRFNNKHLAPGIALTVLGSAAFLTGLFATAVEDIFVEDTNNNAENATFLGFATMTSGILVLVKKDKYPKKKKWQLSILEK